MRSVTISVPHLRFLFSDGSNIRYYTTYNATLSTYATGGNTTTCTPSTLTDQANNNWLATLNMFRSFAGLSAVTIDHSKDSMTSGCALMSAANNQLMHGGWTSSNLCYSTTAADGCSADLTAGERNPMEAVSNLLADTGVVDVGHRTDLLYVFSCRGGKLIQHVIAIPIWVLFQWDGLRLQMKILLLLFGQCPQIFEGPPEVFSFSSCSVIHPPTLTPKMTNI